MDGRRELELLFRGLRERAIDPGRLAAAVSDWDASSGDDPLTFLVERGVLSRDDRRRLESGSSALSSILAAAVNNQALEDTPCPDDAEVTSDSTGGPAEAAWDDSDDAPERYKPIRPHQRGGLGEVWLAWDPVVGREVALKALRPERAGSDTARARFIREAKVTGQLEHPSIVPLYDIGGGERDPFYVMRFVAGRTFAEAATDYHQRRLDGQAGPLDLNALLDAFVNVCRAVAFAHSRNVLHRDLKGQNIVLGEFGEVFLLDWGLAKPLVAADDAAAMTMAEDESDDQLTAHGAKVGTPSFMAPEVARGLGATKSSDVYGLGAILYVLLTGRAPFAGTSASEVLAKVTADEPPPIELANPDAPPALAAMCLKAMARDPAVRYASADELATDVRRWLADEPVTAYREPWLTRAARWARRHRTGVVAAGVLLLTAALASTIAAGLIWREEQQTEAARKQAAENADTAITVADDVLQYVDVLESVGQKVELSRRKPVLEKALSSYERLLDLNPDVLSVRIGVARVSRYLANIYRYLVQTEAAERTYQTSVRHYSALADALPNERQFRQQLVELTRDRAMLFKLVGRLADASSSLNESLQGCERLLQEDPADVGSQQSLANILSEQAAVSYELGQFDAAERFARQSCDHYARLANNADIPHDPIEAALYGLAEVNRGIALRELNRNNEAIKVLEAAIARFNDLATNDPENPDMKFLVALARTERACALRTAPAQRQAGVSELGDSIAAFKSLSEHDKEVPLFRRWLAVSHLNRGRLNLLIGQRAAAHEDLVAAAQLLEMLVNEHADVLAYQRELQNAYSALADGAAEAREAEQWKAKARAALETAMHRNLNNEQLQRSLKELGPPK